MKKLLPIIFTICIAFLLQNCQDNELDSDIVPITNPQSDVNDDIFKAENFGGTATGNFSGLVTNADGIKLSEVQITIGNAVTMTDRNGIFILNNADVFENFAYIKAQKDGYIKGSRVVVPKTDGVNTINIVLLKKEVTATVSSGQASQVSLSNGAQVSFGGDFITADGNPYTGTVDVVLHYLRPNSLATFTQMPGSLFAQNASNDAQSLETYGMLSVNLFSSSGESLNITADSPATIEFPVDFSQNDIAPETINLWYFDEDEGYWKEDGQAIKDGNKYVAEVSHFTWWNCDLPLDFVELCFSLSPTNTTTSAPYLVIITRVSNNQLIFSGNVTSREAECGLIPRNEEISISVYGVFGSCANQLVATQTLGGYSTDTSTTISFAENATTTSIVGTLTSCTGNPITNGYVYINEENTFSISNGTIDAGIAHCTDEIIDIQVFDFDTDQWTIVDNVSLNGTNINLGTLSTCDDIGGIYNNDVVLLTQDDVNIFGLFEYTSINGNIQIGDFSTTTSNISDLTPLLALENAGYVYINNCPNLQSLAGLNNLTSVDRDLRIRNNETLQSIAALSSLENVLELEVSYNQTLTSLTGLEGVTNLNRMRITQNSALTSLTGLESITSLSSINISNNAVLNSIVPLSNITSADYVQIYGLPLLTSLQGINQFTSLGLIRVSNNNALTDLSELSNLTSADIISIGGNNSLTSLNGLENMLSSDWVMIGEDLDFDIVVNAPNTSLVDLCALQNLFTNGTYIATTTSPFNGVRILNNAYNPTIQDIIDGNCSQ